MGTRSAVVAVGTALLLAGCGEDQEPERSAPNAIKLSSVGTGVQCFEEDRGDWAWTQVTWRATTDVEQVTFQLVGGTGVTAVGPPISIPPPRFGDDISSFVTTLWPGTQNFSNEPAYDWARREDADQLKAAEGETGVLLFRLRLAGEVVAGEQAAEVGRIEATWRTADGGVGSAFVAGNQTFSPFIDDCAGP